jgi:hypothetical protein
MHALVGSLCEAWLNVMAYILNEVFEYQSTTLSYMSTIIQPNHHRLHHVRAESSFLAAQAVYMV